MIIKTILWILALGCILPIIYSATVFWFCQVSGSLFYTFPRVLIAFLTKKIQSVKPVLIALCPVVFWCCIISFINLVLYIFWYKAFIYFYTNIIVLITTGIAIIQCLLQIGNSEMQNYADNLIDKYKLKEG